MAASDVFIPDGDEAQGWAEEELTKAAYQEAKPTWFDLLARDILEAITDLFSGDGSASVAPLTVTIIVIVLIAALIVALIVWGRPRASRSVRRRVDLLGERDDRTAAQLRSEADRAAKAGEYDAAVILRFRAVARSLLERDLIDPAPGATAQLIARESAVPFPALASELHEAAMLFDRIRYLGVTATGDDYRAISATDAAIAAASPAHTTTTTAATAGAGTGVPA